MRCFGLPLIIAASSPCWICLQRSDGKLLCWNRDNISFLTAVEGTPKHERRLVIKRRLYFLVVMDRKDYIDKATNLLAQPAYRTIDRDPTNKLKTKLITILRRIKRESGLEDSIYKHMYPIRCTSPKFYGLPKIHKTYTPLRPIVSSRGSVTNGVVKVLAKILKPLVGKSPHHVQSTKDFVDKVSKVTLQPGECLCSYDVTALFTSVPVNPALYIIQDLLEQDTSLCVWTVF